MKTKLIRIFSAVLSVLLLSAGGAGVAAYAAAQNGQDKTNSGSAGSVSTGAEATAKPKKNETVYVLAGNDGSVKKIIVSDWIRNTLGEDALKDASDLSGIENVKGDESYTMGGDNAKVWDAQGKDIYYQGTLEKELPVSVSIRYTLDGKTVTADEIAGKSGKVTIRFDYTNRQYRTVTIDGKEERIYVPFFMLTGMLLDNSVFSDIEVTNGKCINDGDRTAVIGVALPGLAENLGVSGEENPIPSYVEITANASEFSLATTVSVATNELFNKIDTSVLDRTTATIEEKMTALNDAMGALLDGSSQLYDGVCTLLEKSGALIDGIGQVADGLKELNENSDILRGGAKKVFDSLLATVQTELGKSGVSVTLTTENYETVLDGVIASLSTAGTEEAPTLLDVVRTAVTAEVRKQVTAQVTETYRAQVTEMVLQSAVGMTTEQYEAALAAGLVTEDQQEQIDAAIYIQMKKASTQTTIEALTDTQMKTEAVQTLIAQNVDEQVAEKTTEITALKSQLNDYNTFYTGVKDYTAGVDEVYAGVTELVSELPKLTAGITELRDGAGQLRDGLNEFNSEVVGKLLALANGDGKTLLTRLRATIDVSKSYTNFSGIGDGMDGQVKFIYRTDAV